MAYYLTPDDHQDITPLRRGKRRADEIAALLEGVTPGHPYEFLARRMAQRLDACTNNVLVGRWIDQETGEFRSKILHSCSCGQSSCPGCGRKRQAKKGMKLVQALGQVLADHPDQVERDVLHVVLTQVNSTYEDLADLAGQHRQAWGWVQDRAFFRQRLAGSSRHQEFEPGFDSRCHDHLHNAVLVRKGYFSKRRDLYIHKLPRERRAVVRQIAAKALTLPVSVVPVLPVGRFVGGEFVRFSRVTMQRHKRRASRRLRALGYTVLPAQVPTYDPRDCWVGAWRWAIGADYWPNVFVSGFKANGAAGKDGVPSAIMAALQVVKYVTSGLSGSSKHQLTRDGRVKPSFTADQLAYVLGAVSGHRISESYGILRDYLTDSQETDDDADEAEAETTPETMTISWGAWDKTVGGFEVVRTWENASVAQVRYELPDIWPSYGQQARKDLVQVWASIPPLAPHQMTDRLAELAASELESDRAVAAELAAARDAGWFRAA